MEIDFPLDEARIVLADADGDGDIDLATYHDGRIVVAHGPLQGEVTTVETAIDGLYAARGEFIDFDEDDVLDFVMREGTGDNLVSYRGLAAGGFEPAGSAEFHADTFCIDEILSEDRDDDWFVALGSDCGGVFASRLRVAVFSVEADGSMVELAAQEFDRDLFDGYLSLRAVGNMLTAFDHEILINGSIWAVDGSQLVEQLEVASAQRLDFDGDRVLDHAVSEDSWVELRAGESSTVRAPRVIFWDLVDRDRDGVELLQSTDVDGDGRDEVVGLQNLNADYSLLVGGAHVDCDQLR